MRKEHRHINTNSDSELLLNVFAEELQRRRISKITPDEIFDAVRGVMRRCQGGYAVVLLVNRIGMVAFRDPNGIRPLCFGRRVPEGVPAEDIRNGVGQGCDWAVASESVAIDALDPNFRLIRDVGPGEALFIDFKGQFHSNVVAARPKLTPCLFEFVYFARPDSVMDGVSIYEARRNMGEKLAKKLISERGDTDIDIVMPIPETSRTSALQCAKVLNIPYREGFVKNRYIARTFIMPGQESRRKTVRLKLNTIKSEFHDKAVLLVDDSIVRGTTCTELIKMAREAGARKVYFASAAPKVMYTNVYGIDIPTREELIAYNRTEAEISQMLHCDGVFYNSLEDVEDSVRMLNCRPLSGPFESSCFNGIYVTNGDEVKGLDGPRGMARVEGGSHAMKVLDGSLPSDNTTIKNSCGNVAENNQENENKGNSDSDSDNDQGGDKTTTNGRNVDAESSTSPRRSGSSTCESIDSMGSAMPNGTSPASEDVGIRARHGTRQHGVIL